MTQPEALRLADWLLDWLDNNVEPADLEAACVNAAAKLRRLHADNEKKSEAIQRLWKKRDELRAQRDELLEALKSLEHEFRKVFPIYYYAEPWAHDRNEVLKQACAAIAKVEEKT